MLTWSGEETLEPMRVPSVEVRVVGQCSFSRYCAGQPVVRGESRSHGWKRLNTVQVGPILSRCSGGDASGDGVSDLSNRLRVAGGHG